MTNHPTLEPTDTARLSADEPSGALATAALAELVCADHELLRAEFDALISANFPDTTECRQRLAPIVPVTAGTDWAPRRCIALLSHPPEREGLTGAQHLRARQRGPPPRTGDSADPRHNKPTGNSQADRRWSISRHDTGRGLRGPRGHRSPCERGDPGAIPRRHAQCLHGEPDGDRARPMRNPTGRWPRRRALPCAGGPRPACGVPRGPPALCGCDITSRPARDPHEAWGTEWALRGT
jgi:hypothetical protein